MMRSTLAVLIAGATAFAAPAARHDPVGDAPFAKQLANLVPGQPQSCINPSHSGGGDHLGNAVLTKDRSGVLYLAHFVGGCQADESDALISSRPSTQLCRGDLVEIRDLTSGISRGSCSYSDFTPYRRVK